MADVKPIIIDGVDFREFDSATDTIDGITSGDDQHSGYYFIPALTQVTVVSDKQMVNFGGLIADGDLIVEGQLILEA
jgi:hypothetical protein